MEYLAHPPRHEPMSEADPTDETTLNSQPSCEMCHQRGRAVCLSIASCPSFCPSIRIYGMDEVPRGRSCKTADQGEHNSDGLAGRSLPPSQSGLVHPGDAPQVPEQSPTRIPTRGPRPGSSLHEPRHRNRPYKIPTSVSFRVGVFTQVIGLTLLYAQVKAKLS